MLTTHAWGEVIRNAEFVDLISADGTLSWALLTSSFLVARLSAVLVRASAFYCLVTLRTAISFKRVGMLIGEARVWQLLLQLLDL
jgi:hypothetical protein